MGSSFSNGYKRSLKIGSRDFPAGPIRQSQCLSIGFIARNGYEFGCVLILSPPFSPSFNAFFRVKRAYGHRGIFDHARTRAVPACNVCEIDFRVIGVLAVVPGASFNYRNGYVFEYTEPSIWMGTRHDLMVQVRR
jgi:hypothetical protein